MIRADDLGYCKAVNYGILDTIQAGVIKNVGFMVNMPESIHGYELIKDYDISLGQHTNVCLGYPCADPKLIPSLLDENGMFKSSKIHRSSKKDLIELEEAIIEVEAQYNRFKEITKKEPAYFEAHAIQSNNLNEAIEIVGQRHHLKVVPFHLDKAVKVHNQDMYIYMDSNDYPDYEPIESFKNMVKDTKEGIHMMVCHPGYIDQDLIKTSSWTTIRTIETEMLLSEEFKTYLKENKIHLYSFDEI